MEYGMVWFFAFMLGWILRGDLERRKKETKKVTPRPEPVLDYPPDPGN